MSDHTEHTERAARRQSLLLPILLFTALAGVMAWGIAQHSRAQSYENYLSGVYNKSYDEIVTNMGALETNLSKLLIAGSPRQSTLLLSEVWRTTGQTSEMLSQIPSNYGDFSGLNRFLSQSGDYCRQLTRTVANGQMLSTQDLDQIASLQGAAVRINATLREEQDRGTPAFVALAAAGNYYADSSVQTTLAYSEEQSEEKYPQLIYDGPFSDSTEKAEARGLGDNLVDEQAAAVLAKAFLGGELAGELTHTEDENGRIPAFGFSGQATDGRTATIFITKQGGKCLSMSIDSAQTSPDGTPPDGETLKQLSQVGQDYLQAKGYDNMASTYAQYYNGYVVINYAATQNDILLYNDLIKVWIEQQTGRVTGIDARNYLFSHVARNIPTPEVSPEDAQMELSESLEVQSIRLAVIPLNPSDERLCYEFKCKFQGDSYIVYVNAVSGIEEQIFKVIDSDSGQLVL